MKTKTILRYSEAFKLKVISKHEQGMTLSELNSMYGIKGGETIIKWLRKYGKYDQITRIVRVEKPDEKNRLKELEKENQQLKDALSKAYIKEMTNESFLEVVSDMMGISIEDLKKKLGEK